MTDPRPFDDAALVAALDAYRDAVTRKLAGLTRQQATAQVLPSGVTLLGIVTHLTAVEDEWFAHLVGGAPMEEHDNEASFVVPDDVGVEDALAAYGAACDRSRAVVAARSLDDATVHPHWYFGHTTVRFAVAHLVHETARHVGHLDVLRELTDGATGW